MRSKDIARLISLCLALLTVGVSFVWSPESGVPSSEDIPTYVMTTADIGGVKTIATVERVVDGDTIVVRVDGVKHTVRFIGVNAPESVDPRRPDQCFSHEASAWLVNRLSAGASVTLIQDPSQDDIDRYQRWLRYVEYDGADLGAELVNEGYAFEYTYKGSVYDRRVEYQIAQENAKAAQRGLWSPETCNGLL